MIENKKVPTVKIDGKVVTPSSDYIINLSEGGYSFYTDSDGQIVADGEVSFVKEPADGKTYKSFYMKDAEAWKIDCILDAEGSFRI